jgi:glutamate-1-semialdehyde 2,1-aminomutase
MSKIEEQYRARTARSAETGKAAEAVMPGGDTRAAGYHPPYPLTLERGEGPFLWDVDGHRYLDLVGNYTSLVHGHAYPPIVEAVRTGVGRGTAWPGRCEPQIALAEQLIDRVSSVEKVRFTNSGTEAAMLAIQIARIITGRRRILMARHGYHGGLEDVETGFYGSEGPHTLIAEYGRAESFERALGERGDEVACVVLEPVMGSAGIIASPPGFLERVREAAHSARALFVLDEVICFRLSTGGAQKLYGVEPDLTMFGKLIGGGLPVGAVGGQEELLAVCDPRAPRMFHSGTFNGNPLTTAAGTIAVQELTAERIGQMERWATRLAAGLEKAAARVGLPFSVNHAGSLLNVFFTETPPPATLVRLDGELITRFHLASLNHGLFFAPRGMIAMSTVMSDAFIDEAIERGEAALIDLAPEQA